MSIEKNETEFNPIKLIHFVWCAIDLGDWVHVECNRATC